MRIQKVFLVLLFLFSLTVKASADPCQDYFTAEWGKPLDMTSEGDINDSFPIFEKSQLTQYLYSGGIAYMTTTGTDPYFLLLTRAVSGSIPDKTTRYGEVHPVDPTKYSQLVVRMNTNQASVLQVFWNKSDGSLGSSAQVPTSVGWNTYIVDLNVGNWGSGLNYGIRVDPSAGISGAAIEIDYIYLTPAGCNNPDLNTAPLVQPDREGGEDHYAAVRGNPANFDSANDAEYIAGHGSASIHPSSSYTDSNNVTRQGDYLQAVNNTSDPVVAPTYFNTKYRIDASRYKIACYSFDLLRSTTVYHSVVRLVWTRDDKYYISDDILTGLTGERRYCFRMDTIPLEPAQNGTHPWRNNSNGTGLDLFRFDALEDSEATTYRLNDVRLAADHEANTRFAIVVGGTRTASVDVQYQASGGSRLPITTLSAGRNSDVVLWDTTAVPDGTYYIYTVTGLNTSISEAPVIISHSRAQETSAPVLNIDAPLDGHRFNNSLQVVGFAVDNIRVANVEVHMDGQFIDSFTPSLFDARARDAYPTAPFNSTAAFNRSIDTSGWGAGSHTVTVTVYDTAGNSVSHTASVTKASDNLTPPFTIPFQELSTITLKQGLQPGAGGGGGGGGSSGKATLTLKVVKKSLQVSATGKNCSTMRLFASTSAKTQAKLISKGTLLQSVSTNKLKGAAKKIPSLNKDKKIYFLADCGDGSTGSVRSVSASSFSGKKITKLAQVFNAITTNYTAK